MKNKIFNIDLQIYPSTITVIFGNINQLRKSIVNVENGEIDKTIKKYFNDKECYGAKTIFLKGDVIIHFRNATLENLYDFIPHESLHAVEFIFENIGMGSLSRDTSEAYAYLLGYITKEIFTNYLKK